ncbi:MAG: protein kinase [Deltaproteobacteria bacterium]|nr:protein kinase [Deltaproteobacteria bacterium]
MQPEALSALLKELAATTDPGDAWESFILPGEIIGRFEMVRELGRGGFGVVFEARDRELGRLVAFKAVRPGTSDLGGEQLEREAEAIARLSHPNLVTLFDVGRCDRGPYLVLELLRGQTLAQRLQGGPLPRSEALRVAVEVARGMAHAHAAGVVHRDLKPSNVFLCEGGAVKVLDFGMAHAFGRQRVSGGTPAYMAPEQGSGAHEDERADVYALGVMLYQMLSGQLPFPSETGRATPAPERPAPPELLGHRRLWPVLARMLERDPAARTRDGQAVLQALEPLASARPRGKRVGLWAGAAALLLAAAAVGGILGNRLARPPGAGTPSVAVLPFATLSSDPDDALFAEGIHGELITQLAKVSGLRVIARGSVLGYREGPRDPRHIAAELGVAALLEGTVQRSGQRVRIAVQLVDPAGGHPLWAERYDRDLSDVFAIQSEVALDIAQTLGATLSAGERKALVQPPTRDAEAYELFRRGVYYWQRSVGVEADNQMAEELLAKAAARDASFALAHAWLAIVQTEARGDCAGGKLHAERARALQPELPHAHAATASWLYFCERNYPEALREYEAAVRDAPNDVGLRLGLGELRTLAGHLDAGLADMQEALLRDPRSYLVSVTLAADQARARRYDEAGRTCALARTLAPGDIHALVLCALIPAWRDGDLAPARRAVEELPRDLPNTGDGAWSLYQLFSLLPEQALAFAEAGRLPEPFSTSPHLPRALLSGTALAALGRDREARAAFEEAVPSLRRAVAEAPGWGLQRLFLARALAGVGRGEEAMAELRQAAADTREEGRRTPLLRLTVEIAAAAGQPDWALAALHQVLARPDGLITAAAARVDPRFAPLRADPRFERTLARAPR